MPFHVFGATTYNLGSSISSTDTSILLSSFVEPVTGVPYTMVLLNTDIAFGTIAPRTTSSEFISFTGITQNADGSATLTGVTRGLAKKYPFTSNADYKLPHAGQTQFIISDAPQVFEEYAAKENDENITGLWNFVQNPTGLNPGAVPDASTTVKGIAKLSVAPVSPTDPIATGTNDTRIPTQDENDALGGTSGTPSSTNKYVTNDDTSNSGSSGKVVRLNSTSYPAGDGSALTGISTGKIYLSTQNVTVSNSNTLSTLYTTTLPGGVLGTNGAVRIRINFSGFRITTVTRQAVISLVYGSNSSDFTISSGAANSSCPGWMEIDLYASGATNTQETSIYMVGTDFNTIKMLVANETILSYQANGTLATDSTANQTLAVKIQFATADADNNITTVNCLIEKIV